MPISLSSSTAPAPISWTPEAYQLKAVRWLLAHGAAGLFLDPGLGKTSISLAAVKMLKQQRQLPKGEGFLVIAPLRPAYMVWPAEVRKWADFNELTVSVLHGDKKEEALAAEADLYVINPDGLEWLFRTLWRQRRWPFHGLIVDESTMFKHSNTSRFKLLAQYLARFRRRWILTGTPSPNGLLDLFGQLYILDLGAALGRYVTHFRRTYFYPTGYGGYTWLPMEGAEERIYRQVAPLVLRMDRKDYLKLPPLVGRLDDPRRPPNLTRVTLPPKARKLYDQLELLMFAELEAGSITAANAGVVSMKCRQVANGGIYLDKGDEDNDLPKTGAQVTHGRVWYHVHDAKTEAVVEILDELSGKPALVSFDFHHDLARLRKHRDLRNVPAMGEGSMREDQALEKAWNAGQLHALLVNPQSAKYGLNLQDAGRAVIWHALTWNFEDYDQLIQRVHRRGQKQKVFVYHVVASNTVDELLIAALRGKNKTQRGLLDALRAYALRQPVKRV